MSSPRLETVQAYFECLDTEDWSRMEALWCENGELRAVGARPREDRSEVLGYFAKLFAPWPSHEDKPTRLICDGDTIVAEVTFTGTMANGQRVSFDAIDVFDFEAGRIRRMSNWYDIAYARRVIAEDPATST